MLALNGARGGYLTGELETEARIDGLYEPEVKS